MITFFREFYMYFKYALDGLTHNPISIAKKLEKSQYWDRSKIENNQLMQINNLIADTKKNVKYYQTGKYKNISTFENLDSFAKYYPVIDKEDIKENANFLTNTNNKSFIHTTSGSTGKPMSFYISDLAVAYRIANNIRFYHWCGVNMFDKNVLIWKKRKQKKSIRLFFKKIELKLLGRMELVVFELNDSTIYDYFKKIDDFKPKYIRGYKSAIFELARLMDKHGLQFEKNQLKVAVVTAEILFENEKNLIERVLKCRVANEYGAADGGLYASECPEGSLHVNEESVYISTDNSDNLYVTEIFNKAMPLINYKNEDRLVFSDKPCSCGRNSRVIKEVKGRISDYVLCPDGTRKNGLMIGTIFSKIERKCAQSIIQFRVIQEDFKLKIELIPGENFVNEFLKEIEDSIHNDFSKGLEIELKVVQKIEAEKNGKVRFFIRKS